MDYSYVRATAQRPPSEEHNCGGAFSQPESSYTRRRFRLHEQPSSPSATPATGCLCASASSMAAISSGRQRERFISVRCLGNARPPKQRKDVLTRQGSRPLFMTDLCPLRLPYKSALMDCQPSLSSRRSYMAQKYNPLFHMVGRGNHPRRSPLAVARLFLPKALPDRQDEAVVPDPACPHVAGLRRSWR